VDLAICGDVFVFGLSKLKHRHQIAGVYRVWLINEQLA